MHTNIRGNTPDRQPPDGAWRSTAHDWPHKRELFGIPISWTDYAQASECILAAAERRRPALATALAVHGLILASENPQLGGMIRDFDLVAPDGQPVRWALDWFHGCAMPDRVYGPALMLEVCRGAAERQLGVYLYGATEATVRALAVRLQTTFPRLTIVGSEPSSFRPLTSAEDAALCSRIDASGAAIVFVGLGCPRQEIFAHQHRERWNAVQICVGAAFDFHAGTKRMAPRWMQDHALEWLFRLNQEPRRLLGRYTVTNARFLLRVARELVRLRRLRRADRVIGSLE